MFTKEQLSIIEKFATDIEFKIFYSCYSYEQEQKQFRLDYQGQPNNSFNKCLSLRIYNTCLAR